MARFPAKERAVLSKESSLTLEPTEVTFSVDTVGTDLSPGVEWRSMQLTTHLRLVPMIKMTSRPPYAFVVIAGADFVGCGGSLDVKSENLYPWFLLPSLRLGNYYFILWTSCYCDQDCHLQDDITELKRFALFFYIN